MLNVTLATLAAVNIITDEQAIEISNKLGNKIVSNSIQEMIEEIKKILISKENK